MYVFGIIMILYYLLSKEHSKPQILPSTIKTDKNKNNTILSLKYNTILSLLDNEFWKIAKKTEMNFKIGKLFSKKLKLTPNMSLLETLRLKVMFRV